MASLTGVRRNDFLDAWFELRPQMYNQFFGIHDGQGSAMVETLMELKPDVARVVARRAELVRAKRLSASSPRKRSGGKSALGKRGGLGNVGIA